MDYSIFENKPFNNIMQYYTRLITFLIILFLCSFCFSLCAQTEELFQQNLFAIQRYERTLKPLPRVSCPFAIDFLVYQLKNNEDSAYLFIANTDRLEKIEPFGVLKDIVSYEFSLQNKKVKLDIEIAPKKLIVTKEKWILIDSLPDCTTVQKTAFKEWLESDSILAYIYQSAVFPMGLASDSTINYNSISSIKLYINNIPIAIPSWLYNNLFFVNEYTTINLYRSPCKNFLYLYLNYDLGERLQLGYICKYVFNENGFLHKTIFKHVESEHLRDCLLDYRDFRF